MTYAGPQGTYAGLDQFNILVPDSVLGSQWTSAVPIVQIIALSFLFAFYADFPSALLNSLGQFRENLWRAAIAYPVSALIMMCAAYFGLYAIAFSMFIVMPLQLTILSAAGSWVHCISRDW